MGISRDDINIKVRILKGKREEEERREVSPVIPFHIIRNPSLLTNLDLSVSDGSSKQHPLDMLASQAVVNYLRPENVFFLDKTGNNTHGKDDGNQGGQRKVVAREEVPKEIVGARDSHFTITPITDATGKLRFVVVIFTAKEVFPEWSLGMDIFTDWVQRTMIILGQESVIPV